MIGLALAECRKLGITRVLMTCDKDNIGSAKSIVKNGGILENEIVNEDGVTEHPDKLKFGGMIRRERI